MNIVNLPEAGEAVTLAFDLDAMEALFAEYGDEYVGEISRRLALRDPRCLRLCVQHMASAEIELADLLKKMPVDDLANRIAEAMTAALVGKTAEQADVSH